ncbi:hypothetical protein FAB82_10400 [Glycomyces buryatensis]|uniref:Uncharacterized protein n=1 Tax=Glycomyces buryatensis TaxID=2570927 RepID=A0A4S8QBJ8_9ACTN|nr:hypothetical protein FAB82_10400 [Glycomyces buryatensis]
MTEAIDLALADKTQETPAIEALVGVALTGTDRAFIERCCLKAGSSTSSGAKLLGIAGLCLGHTARRFGRLSPEAIRLARSLAARARLDPSDVSTNAIDGHDDITWILRRARAKWRRGRR